MDQNNEELSIWNIPSNIIIESQSPLFGNLHVGTYNAGQKAYVKKLNIGAVITAAKDCDCVSFIPEDKVEHMILDKADDVDEFDMTQYFDQTFVFIDAQLKKTNVLVHCFAGAQRSVTIVTAYLIRKRKIPSEEALTYVQERRKIADPNEGFRQQLQKFAEKILNPKIQQQKQQIVNPEQQQVGQKNQKEQILKPQPKLQSLTQKVPLPQKFAIPPKQNINYEVKNVKK